MTSKDIPAEFSDVCWDTFKSQVLIGDGHTIFDPSQYEGVGLPAEWLVDHEHMSDTSDHKSTLFVGGKAVKSIKGIYHLTLLRQVARTMEADCSDANRMYGRGSEAQALVVAIVDKLKEWDIIKEEKNEASEAQ